VGWRQVFNNVWGIQLTPVAPRCSIWGHGRLSQDNR
jgi:hypothetical protein